MRSSVLHRRATDSEMGSPLEDKVETSEESIVSRHEKICSAFFYGVSSFSVIFVNKWVLSSYAFPDFLFLAATQFFSTSLILLALSLLKKIELPAISMTVVYEVGPISLMFLGNVLTGLGSTQSLNLPMFTALRRFSILMTMLGEFFVLGREASLPVTASVVMMVGGALVAALNDLTFDLQGYTLVFFNDLFTAMNGIYMKKATINGKCTKMGVLFYNSLFSSLAMLLLYSGDMVEALNNRLHRDPLAFIHSPKLNSIERILIFPGWTKPDFVALFVSAALMGSVLNYSIFLCTTKNSALTTTVIGCLKNVLTTYIGMLFMPDYAFNWLNFIGLNVSIIGSLYYTYVTMVKGLPGFGGG